MTSFNLSTVACALTMLGAGASLGIVNNAEVYANAIAHRALAESSGRIDSVSLDTSSFVLRTDNDIVTLKVNDDTVYMLDGNTSTRDEALKVGHAAKVQHDDGTASRVEATSDES
jgi:hypothetical protein